MRESLNIIFLDIDGVLNSLLFYVNRIDKSIDIDVAAVKLLKELCESTNSKIVITSTWRINRNSSRDFGTLEKIFKEYNLEIFDCTPVRDDRCRGLEIKEWLGKERDFDINNFCIIDDDAFDIISIDNLKDHLVRTYTELGLKEKECEIAKNLLCHKKEDLQ